MKLEFKREDFMPDLDGVTLSKAQCDIAAFVANAKLAAYLKEYGKVVECQKLGESGLSDQHGPGWAAYEPSTRLNKFTTHKAILINLEEIKPCAHEAKVDWRYPVDPREPVVFGHKCKHCGVKLKPSGWVEDK